MISWQVVVKRLKEKNALANKLSITDWEYLLTSKVGIFTQIKEVMIKGSHDGNLVNEVVLPCIGLLQTNITEVRKKIGYCMRYIDWCVKFSEKSDETMFDKEQVYTKQLLHEKDLVMHIGKLAHLYLQKEYEFYVTKKQTEEVMQIKEKIQKRISIDPVVRGQVEVLLSNPRLTLEGFIYQMKLINTPVTKDWFLIAYQNINDLFRKKTKALMSKAEFKELLKKGGLDVEG